jgi:hypothetical protein
VHDRDEWLRALQTWVPDTFEHVNAAEVHESTEPSRADSQTALAAAAPKKSPRPRKPKFKGLFSRHAASPAVEDVESQRTTPASSPQAVATPYTPTQSVQFSEEVEKEGEQTNELTLQVQQVLEAAQSQQAHVSQSFEALQESLSHSQNSLTSTLTHIIKLKYDAMQLVQQVRARLVLWLSPDSALLQLSDKEGKLREELQAARNTIRLLEGNNVLLSRSCLQQKAALESVHVDLSRLAAMHNKPGVQYERQRRSERHEAANFQQIIDQLLIRLEQAEDARLEADEVPFHPVHV